MSWGDYISNCLINKASNNHVYNNVLTDAAIMGFNGAEWAKTDKFTVSKAEVDELTKLFKQPGANGIPSVNLAGKKYQVTHYEPGTAAYLKIKDGGATVAKTNQAYIIGVYNTTKKYIQDKKEMPQCVGMCNMVVEDLATQLKGMNY